MREYVRKMTSLEDNIGCMYHLLLLHCHPALRTRMRMEQSFIALDGYYFVNNITMSIDDYYTVPEPIITTLNTILYPLSQIIVGGGLFSIEQ